MRLGRGLLLLGREGRGVGDPNPRFPRSCELPAGREALEQ